MNDNSFPYSSNYSAVGGPVSPITIALSSLPTSVSDSEKKNFPDPDL